jgi:hypothetical protein
MKYLYIFLFQQREIFVDFEEDECMEPDSSSDWRIHDNLNDLDSADHYQEDAPDSSSWWLLFDTHMDG